MRPSRPSVRWTDQSIIINGSTNDPGRMGRPPARRGRPGRYRQLKYANFSIRVGGRSN